MMQQKSATQLSVSALVTLLAALLLGLGLVSLNRTPVYASAAPAGETALSAPDPVQIQAADDEGEKDGEDEGHDRDHGSDQSRDESRRDDSRRDDSHRDESRRDDSRRDDSHRDESRRDDSRRDESRRDESRRDESRRDDSRRDDSRRDESRRDDSHRDDSHRDESRRDDSHRDESRRDERSGQRARARSFSLQGKLIFRPANRYGLWLIGGVPVLADGKTRFEHVQGLRPGRLVEVKFYIDSQGLYRAVKIEGKTSSR